MRNYRIGLYEKALPTSLGYREMLEEAKGAGFDYIELSVDETDARLSRLEWSDYERNNVLCISRKCGVPFGSICLSGHRKYPLGSNDPAICARGMEIMEKAIRLAEDLGIRMIQLAGYDVYYEPSTPDTARRFADHLELCVKMAAKEGVQMGFETMETPFMDTVGKAMKYVDMANSPYLGVYPDLGNLTNASLRYDVSLSEDLKKGKGHIVAAHIKETLPDVYREVPFTTGHVAFETALKTCWELGVRRYVTELWYTGQKDWRGDVAFAARLARNILDSCDVEE
jgi:L-ribulose-5-phosphate 3-epimerase